MKTSLLSLLIAFLLSFACEAQTQKGAIMIGGSGGVGFKDAFSISLNPNLGFFVTNDFAIGAGVPLQFYKQKDYNSVSGGLQPFARYYFGKPAATRLFAQANGMYHLSRSKGGSPNDPNKINTYSQNSFGGGLGLVHFVIEQVGLEAKLSYTNGQMFPAYRGGGFGLNFGIQVHLARSEK
jgi:hypothetical protein